MIVVGIPACVRDVAGQPQHAALPRYSTALLGGAGAIPVLIPPIGRAALPLLDRIDGLLLSGSPSNVDPALYGALDETPEFHDTERDATTFPLIRAAIERGLPLLAICRGIQEVNVALGGSLHQRVHTVPGRLDHRGGDGERAHRYRLQHRVALSGSLAALWQQDGIEVNSVHGQAIDRLGDGLIAEAVAPDGTIEGARAQGPGFAVAVQWHPEWNYADDANSTKLFAAFGDACRAYAGIRRAA